MKTSTTHGSAVVRLLGFLLAWAIALTATWSLAQGVVTRGGALKKKAYQTYANMTLYVDPTGSDTNACTSSGTGACATLDGALALVPKLVRHAVTINVAAGTYASVVSGLTGFTMTGSGSLTVAGSMAAAAIATGTTSGTVTASTTGSIALGLATVTDSSQSWTVNDLRGKFFTNGGFSLPIVSNTATTLTLAKTVAAGVGSAYSIDLPAATFTAGSTIAGPFVGSTTALTFRQLRWTGANPFTWTNSGTGFLAVESAFEASSGSGFAASSRATLTRVLTKAAGANAALSFSQGSVVSRATSITSSLAWASGSGIAILLRDHGFSTVNVVVAVVTGASGAAMRAYGASSNYQANTSFSATYLLCDSATGTYGLDLGAVEMYGTGFAGGGGSALGGFYVSGCGIGLLADTGTMLRPALTTFVATPTAVKATHGGVIILDGFTPTFSGVTNELSLDGDVYPFSFLTGLPSPQVISNSYGSTIMR